MPKTVTTKDSVIDDVARNLFLVIPLFRKRLLHMDALQRESNLPLSHAMVMGLLSDNGPMNISEISQNLGIAKPNITPLVDKLTDDGFVERKRDEVDRRMVNVSLCPAGATKLKQIRRKARSLVGNWAKTLSNEELEELNTSLETIYRVLGNTLQRVHKE